MPLISVTRLRIRSIRFVPAFLWMADRALRQARAAPGCQAAGVRRERGLVFWTMTVWDNIEAMRSYMGTGAHKAAMPKLKHWCDEASLAHWEDSARADPDWSLAQTQLAARGRTSRVKYPSEAHARGDVAPSA